MVHYINIPISKAKPGMILGSAVEDRLGRHLAESGSMLTAFVIDGLKNYGVQTLTVRFGRDEEGEADTILSPAARVAVMRLREPDPVKVQLTASVKQQVSKGIEYMYTVPDNKLMAGTVKSITLKLMNAIVRNKAVALNISELKTSDEYTFNHSVDVATISMIIAKAEGMSEHEIAEIGSAGLLHDIGKTLIPPEILNKPAKLTPEEFEVIKQHSRLSYDLVKKNPEISLSVAMAMLQHHEKTDGSGYPVGAMANLIHPYAKIMAVADIYDALVSTRPYKKAYTPGEAVDILLGMSSCLDMRALQTFMKVMVLYPVDSLVKLSNGETARVVKQNANLLLRPVVVGVKSGKVYDLSKIECANILIRS